MIDKNTHNGSNNNNFMGIASETYNNIQSKNYYLTGSSGQGNTMMG